MIIESELMNFDLKRAFRDSFPKKHKIHFFNKNAIFVQDVEKKSRNNAFCVFLCIFWGV